MIIDFHTHIFPDKIAQAAIHKLASLIQLEPSMNGTADGLHRSMEDAGVDVSVVLPPVTDPHQYASITRFACFLNEQAQKASPDSPRVISFAGMHPDCSDYSEKLKEIKSLGFAGIKIHPDYQDALFNDIRYKRILYKATELDLACVTHTGFDVYSPNLIHCTVDMILEVLEDVHPSRLVLAHMGNNQHLDEVEEKLIGKDVYFDTAFTITDADPAQLTRMIQNHGADKILFDTDAPWTSQKEAVKRLSSLPLTEEEKEKIFWKNAASLLHL